LGKLCLQEKKFIKIFSEKPAKKKSPSAEKHNQKNSTTKKMEMEMEWKWKWKWEKKNVAGMNMRKVSGVKCANKTRPKRKRPP
jgi:hypothetical protein